MYTLVLNELLNGKWSVIFDFLFIKKYRLISLKIFCEITIALSIPRVLALSIAHWLLTVPTPPDFDLRRVELDINDMIRRTGCDCNVNVYILFFLTFSVKLLF